MAVVEHGSGLSGCQFVGSRVSGQHGYFTGQGNAIVAFTTGIDKPVVAAVQVQCVWHVVAVFQGDPHPVTLLDANRRGRQAQSTPGLPGFKVLNGHAD